MGCQSWVRERRPHRSARQAHQAQAHQAQGVKDRACRQPGTPGQLLLEEENSEALLQDGGSAYQGDEILRTKRKARLFVSAICTVQERSSAPLRHRHEQRHVAPFQARGLFFFHKASRGHMLQRRTLEAGFMGNRAHVAHDTL